MNIRPAKSNDLEAVDEIDCVIESSEYLHIDRSGEGLSVGFRIEKRPLREKLISPNLLHDEARFAFKQIVGGLDEGVAMIADHDAQVIGSLLAQPDALLGTMRVLDLRIDCGYRRQGLATVMLYQLIERAREAELRAVSIMTQTNNAPAAAMLEKLGFELSGLDTRRLSNHDLVKESATLMWYYAID